MPLDKPDEHVIRGLLHYTGTIYRADYAESQKYPLVLTLNQLIEGHGRLARLLGEGALVPHRASLADGQNTPLLEWCNLVTKGYQPLAVDKGKINSHDLNSHGLHFPYSGFSPEPQNRLWRDTAGAILTIATRQIPVPISNSYIASRTDIKEMWHEGKPDRFIAENLEQSMSSAGAAAVVSTILDLCIGDYSYSKAAKTVRETSRQEIVRSVDNQYALRVATNLHVINIAAGQPSSPRAATVRNQVSAIAEGYQRVFTKSYFHSGPDKRAEVISHFSRNGKLPELSKLVNENVN